MCRVSSNEWKKENTAQYGIRLMNSTGIPQALDAAVAKTGKSRNAYIIEALREKLIRDGYLSESE